MNAIEIAVEPLKANAQKNAAEYAESVIAKFRAELEAAGGDLEKVAPFPRSTMRRPAYMAAKNRRSLVRTLTRADASKKLAGPFLRVGAPEFVVMDPEACARFVSQAREDASAQYLVFVTKLTAKIGDVTEAALRGSNAVWTYSILDVTKADGAKESWQTQQIINVSVLGKVFNQWPTRKLKA